MKDQKGPIQSVEQSAVCEFEMKAKVSRFQVYELKKVFYKRNRHYDVLHLT